MKPKSERFLPRRPTVLMEVVTEWDQGPVTASLSGSLPPRRLDGRGVSRVLVETRGTSRPWKKPSLPNASRVREMPSDRELVAAQAALDETIEMIRLRDALLKAPEWVPVGDAVHTLGREIRRLRAVAANLLRCDPILLDDDGE